MILFLQSYFCICFLFSPDSVVSLSLFYFCYYCWWLVIKFPLSHYVSNLHLSFHLLLLPLLSYVIIFPLELCYIVTICPKTCLIIQVRKLTLHPNKQNQLNVSPSWWHVSLPCVSPKTPAIWIRCSSNVSNFLCLRNWSTLKL